jgi:hypothetical protein
MKTGYVNGPEAVLRRRSHQHRRPRVLVEREQKEQQLSTWSVHSSFSERWRVTRSKEHRPAAASRRLSMLDWQRGMLAHFSRLGLT